MSNLEKPELNSTGVHPELKELNALYRTERFMHDVIATHEFLERHPEALTHFHAFMKETPDPEKHKEMCENIRILTSTIFGDYQKGVKDEAEQ